MEDKLVLRGRIIGMLEAGKKVGEVAQHLGIHRHTVRNWKKRFDEENSLKDRPRCGAPRKTTEEQDQAIINEVTENPFTNATQITRSLHLPVTDRTVRRKLHSAGIHHRVPSVKEKLTQGHRDKRLQFATEYAHRDMDFWSRVIFTDEKTFASHNHGRLHCWRKNNTRYENINIYEEARSGHVTCNVWGWINFNIHGELTPINGRFTADQYIEILEEVFLPSVRTYAFPYPEKIIFMQDNSPIHTAKIVRRWFEERTDIEVLPWPSKGCDLNPIENIWANIVNAWDPQDEKTKQALTQHTLNSWDSYRKLHHYTEKCIGSMPRRLHSVILNNGGWTKY
jgi:transposase